jgi:hypothetical protein
MATLPFYNVWGGAFDPKPVHQLPQPDTDHSRHCGELHDLLLKLIDRATLPLIEWNARPRSRVISLHAPTVLTPALSVCEQEDEYRLYEIVTDKSRTNRDQTIVQWNSSTRHAASDPISPTSLKHI